MGIIFSNVPTNDTYGLTNERKEASGDTMEVYQEFLNRMAFEDSQEKAFATKGMIMHPEQLKIDDSEGGLIWTQEAFKFLDREEWDLTTVHPGLWQNASLNHLYGLFEVTDSNYTGDHKIYQVRGYDLANTTFIKSDTGWIVIDTLTSQQAAEAALELMRSVFGPIEIKGVIISHNHADHFGGMASFISQEQVYNKSPNGTVRLIVPENFLKYVISENLYAGTAELFAKDSEIAFQSHNWPRWGNSNILDFLLLNTQVYRFIHDQTLRFANMGYNDEEIAEILELPDGLNNSWIIQPNYGALESNVKAVYQKYLGWYDSNPVNLNPIPDAMSAKKYVEYMGGSQSIIQKAVQDYDNGEYRWVAEIVFKVVLAEPENMEARYLCADALEQLGYQADSGIWRNAYLSGAFELRHGQVYSKQLEKARRDIMKSMTAPMIFDYLGILFNGKESQDLQATIDITLQDTGEQYQLVIENGTVITFKQPGIKQADLSITMMKAGLLYFTMKMLPPQELMIETKGNISLLKEFLSSLTSFDKNFAIMSNRLF